MKKIIVLILIVGAGAYLWQERLKALNPDVITNPVYAAVRITTDFPGNRGQVEGVLLIQAVDQADCKKQLRSVDNILEEQGKKGGSTWTKKAFECKTELTSREARLFNNEPTFVTYLSAGRGQPSEREHRLIYWGLTVEQSNKICEATAPIAFRKDRKGQVACIYANGAKR